MNRNYLKSAGFTLVELLLAVVILGFTLAGLIQVFIRCSALSELSRNKTTAMSEIQGKMEEIRNHAFSTIATAYASGGTPGDTFDLSQLTGKGIIYIDSSNASLLEIKVVACWQDKYDRIVGEDLDLDGVLDTGEDADGNGEISSPATLITKIASR